MNRMLAGGLAAALMLASTHAVGQDQNARIVQGRVLAVTPVVRIVEVPERREVCTEQVVRRQGSETVPTVVGAVIGGAIGNQFGGGNGRRALTVAGALLGGSIANENAQRRNQPYARTSCRVVEEYREEERAVGYRVEYEYQGEVFTTRTQRDPGQYIDLEVSVSPVGF